MKTLVANHSGQSRAQSSLWENCFYLLTFGVVRQHGQLTWEMVKRNLFEKHSGQVFGLFWFFLQPLVFMAIYTFIFGFVLAARGSGSNVGGPIYILAGLIPWLTFADVFLKSCSSLRANISLVKQVIFPIEILPYVTVLSALVIQTILLVSYLAYWLLSQQNFSETLLLLPVFLYFQVLGLVGIALVCSCIAILVRDLPDLIQLICTLGIYFTPVLFRSDQVPSILSLVIQYNPLSSMIFCVHDIFVHQSIQSPMSWAIFCTLSVIVFTFGNFVFSKFRSQVGNFL